MGELRRRRSLWISVALILLPAIVFYPYRWFVFDYAQYSILSESVSEPEHRRFHLVMWFVLTFNPFMFACLGLGVPLLVWTLFAGHDRKALSRLGAFAWGVFAATLAIIAGVVTWIGMTVVLLFVFELGRSGQHAIMPALVAIVIVFWAAMLAEKFFHPNRPSL